MMVRRPHVRERSSMDRRDEGADYACLMKIAWRREP